LCRKKVFEEALNAVKFLGWLKRFAPEQNILGPVKGQGIRIHFFEKKQFILSFILYLSV
jgi:hypothetical protein